MLAHAADRPETKRPHIERAALRLFLQRGVRGTTVRDIAARAGVAQGTLYRHWRSKRDLARTLFRDCAAAIAGEVRQAVSRERGSRAQLTAAVRALFNAAREETLFYELLALPPSRETERLVSAAESPATVLADVIAEGQRRREFVAVDAQLAAECIVGAINRIALWRRLGTLQRDLTQYEDDIVAGVLTTLGAQPRRRTRRMRIRSAALAVLLYLSGGVPAFAAPVDIREIRQNLFGACFANERDGWMVGELGRIFRTRDGGASWERQDAGTKRPFLAVECIDADTAWIAGKEGIVYGTRDGGRSWQPATTGASRHVFTLQFANRERGHGAGDYGAMIHTEDGGRTWTTQQVPPEVQLPETAIDIGVDPGDVNLYGLSYGDADHVWLVGEFGIVMTSDDGGRSWRQQHSPVETTLFGVYFADATHGWAVGIDGVSMRTEDGGASWTVQPTPLAQRALYDVFVRGDIGWIVGDAGTVLKSNDGGATWAVHPLPIQLAAHWLRSVWVAPNGTGLVVGAEGLVFRVQGATLERLAAATPAARGRS
jgi:photosystem II stability/assembly factor-like uncharacterized protein/AcrR family transcriptional regulator